MPVPKGRKVMVRGGRRMKESGMKRVDVWLDPNELALITSAARSVGKKLATWIREQAFHAACAATQSKKNGGAR